MAVNKVKFPRNAIRLIRDGIKSNYTKNCTCSICGTTGSLELHHYNTVSLLVKNFAKENNLDFNNEEIVLDNRNILYEKYWHELVVDTVTLCNTHHTYLHTIYGVDPALSTADKQRAWVEKQRNKINNKQTSKPKTSFSGFL